MADETYPITGIPLVLGQPFPLRQEITAWFNNDANKYQVSLFLQALAEFKKKDIEDKLSYFQVAGIHCYPLVGWDGVKGPDPVSSDPFPGFCAHNRVTFPTWHRPYMLLYEQVLYQTMEKLIKDWVEDGQLSDRKEEEIWRTAASKFRLPYWDWARKQAYTGTFSIPQACTLDSIDIIMPGGLTKSFSNPLVKFQNPKVNKEGKHVAMGDKSMGNYAIDNHNPNNLNSSDPFKLHILPWSNCVATSRYGILVDPHHGLGPEPAWVNGVNNWDYCNQALADPQWYGQDGGSLADAVSRMFSYGDLSWETFASTKWNNPSTNAEYLSLEYIHNVLHNITGGQYMAESDIPEGSTGFLGLGLGHMSDVPVAAFDPIFWLHHCNIDRLTAIWQTLNWKKWFDDPNPGPQPDPPEKPLPPDPLPSDPLLPFHYDTKNNAWSSDRARNWRELNYQYDDLVPQPHTPEDSPKYLEELRNHINELYPSTSSILRNTVGYIWPGETFHDYVINVVYDRYALGGFPYSILFFIGEAPKDLSTYRHSNNFVGAVYTFSTNVENADGSPACGNCAQQRSAKVLSKAHIPITLQLLSKVAPAEGGEGSQLPAPSIRLGAFEPSFIESYLGGTTNDAGAGLRMEFVTLGGQRVDQDQFPDTEVAVLHGTGTHAREAGQLPVYRGYKILRDAVKHHRLGWGYDSTREYLIKDDPNVQ